MLARSLRQGGHALDAGLARQASSRFGVDFSQVRVHDDALAAQAARASGAKALASGSDLVFGAGQYRPHDLDGQKLIAHELAHVAQHTKSQSSPAAPSRFSEPGGESERSADAASEAFVSGQSLPALGALPSGTVARTCSDGRCEDCAGGRRDLWVTVFFRRRATTNTMTELRADINAAKATLANCCIDLKFDFDWRLLRGPSIMAAPPARPAGDPDGALDYSDDVEQLGEGTTFSGARGIPMVVADEVPGSGGGMTVTGAVDNQYTGRTFMVWALNRTNRGCSAIAHELWHVGGNFTHDPAAGGSIADCTGNGVTADYCTRVRGLA